MQVSIMQIFTRSIVSQLSSIIIALITLALTGCGQRGGLYLPNLPPPPQSQISRNLSENCSERLLGGESPHFSKLDKSRSLYTEIDEDAEHRQAGRASAQ